MARSDHSDRDKAERIDRLVQRLRDAAGEPDELTRLRGIIRGILDLLADEL